VDITPTDIAGFAGAMCAAGLTPSDAIAPGRFHRFPGDGKRNGNTAGWCKLFNDGRGGVFGDFATGLVESWRAERPGPMRQSEREAFWRKVEESKAQAEAKQKKEQAQAARVASKRWEAATPARADHPYLVRKGIKAHGVRQDGDDLVAPMRDASGKLCSLQFIAPDGNKKFLPGGRVRGCYYAIGKLDGAVCVAEGLATAASIHEATECAVAATFNAGNLEPVAVALRDKLREKYGDELIIICADDDNRTTGNPGLAKATEAALAVGISARLAVPDFGNDRPQSPRRTTRHR
jgi:putative DNA primase/helicase